MFLDFSGQQALSRKYALEHNKWDFKSAPENPLTFSGVLEIVHEPFTFPIAGLLGRRVTAGAMEYIDEENNKYLSDRWPAKLTIKGSIEVPDDWTQDHRALVVIRKLLWEDKTQHSIILPDQRSQVLGYRREFQHIPSTDIFGHPRPVLDNGYSATDLGEPLSPGFIGFDLLWPPTFNSQFVWSEVLKYPARTNYATDEDAISKLIKAKVRHYNSHSELRDSQDYIAAGDRKGAVMSAACAVEVCLKHCIETRFVSLPKAYRSLPFDEKIAKVLELSELPSFNALEPKHSKNLLYLYDARSARHEGECYYLDDDDQRVDLRTIDQVKTLVASARAFVFWMDTIV